MARPAINFCNGTETRNMPASGPFCAIFDLDGTLVDTAPDLAAGMNAAMADAGLPPVPVATVRHLVGRGARVLVERGLAINGIAHPGDGEIDRLVAIFLSHYRENIAAGSVAYDGAVDVLKALSARGVRMGVCTNKPTDLAVKLLQLLELDHFFHAILGADALPVKKPHPEHLFETIRRSGGAVERAVMIGDSETDVATARAAGVPVIVFSHGYTAIAPQDLGADVVLDHFDGLLPALTSAGLAP